MRNKGWKFKLFTTSVVLLLLAVSLFCSSSQAAGNSAVSISKPITGIVPAKIKQVAGNLAIINIDKFPQGGSPGDPMLPYKTMSLLVPPDTDLTKVTAKLASGKWEELSGEYEIAPVPPAATSNEGKSIISWGGKDPSIIVNGRDTTVYGKNAYFPAETVQIESVGMFRQWKIVEVRVWLAVYNPVAKKVRVVSEPQITLTAEKLPAGEAVGLNSAVLPKFPNTEKFIPELKSKIDNTQDIETFYGEQSATGGGPAPLLIPADYVIITTNQIVANSNQLASFITAKTTAGFTVKTVTEGAAPETDTTYVTGGNCEQRANNIRTWLVNHYLGDGIKYVLLVGKPDPCAWTANMSVPMRWCWPRSGQASDITCPSDMFFAELSGNWDFDGDGKCGEFNGDYRAGGADKNCELKVGRIPVYNINCADLNNILQKSISYDTNTSANAWRAKVLLPAAISNWQPQDDSPYDGFDDYSWGDTFGDDWGEAIKNLANSISFTPYTLYEKTGVDFPATLCNAALNQANVVNEWINQYGFVTWWGHGNHTGAYRRVWLNDNNPTDGMTECPAETSDIAFINNGNCASLDDNTPSFVVQISCQNGWPEDSANLGYSLLKHGAIGTISGTRNTWYAIGSWGTGQGASVGDNASYGYYCFSRMANSSEDIGTALVYCRSNFGTAWADGASWMNMIEFSLYGDPSLALNVTVAGPKWKQPPDTSENGMDIRCDRKDQIPRLLADDFNCTQTGPITKITIWGSWHGDSYYKGVINDIHLSIHSDKPDPDGNQGPLFSEPNELLWSQTISKANITESLFSSGVEEWWWDPYTQGSLYWPGDYQIWKYDINIPSDPFVQQGDPNHPIVYWLDAYVDLDMNQSPTGAEFGWKTSSQHWNDDAVRLDNVTLQWFELRYPAGNPGHPYCPNSIDLAFAIHTSEVKEPKAPMKHLKWSQPPVETDPSADNITFCGWDEKSYLLPSGSTGIQVYENIDTGGINGYYSPGTALLADDIDLAGTSRTLDHYDFTVYAPSGTAPYTVTSELYTDSGGLPGTPIPGTSCVHSVTSDYAVVLDCAPGSGAILPNNVWMVLSFSNSNAGWSIGEAAELGNTDDLFAEYSGSSWSLYYFGGSPYAGFEANIWCQEQTSSMVKMVADDFRCLGSMPITSIHWWGSYFDWEQGEGLPPILPKSWWIGFWTNVPANSPPNFLTYSYPETLIHAFTVNANRVAIEEIGTDEYYGHYPHDICYQYTLNLEPDEVFWQDDYNDMTQDNVFWISIVAIYDTTPVDHPWGWKTRPWHWMDDAVTINLTGIPADGSQIDPLTDTVTPLTDPQWGDSMDVSFELDTDPNYIKWEQDFNGIRAWSHYEDVNSTLNTMDSFNERLVADDWRCVRRTPVTAIVWWGSYIGYQYQACGTTFWPLPVPPNKFLLKIWTDVPADPCDPMSFSHPGYVIWQYDTNAFNEVLVGYDKHPEQEQPIRSEPVFRYSVRLPEERWFRQPDYNQVFWLSVQAIYDINQPNYLWGWTNHQHVFNDDAVQRYLDQSSGLWKWTELYDQTDASEDMSFVLFTDPNVCSTCANYNCDSIVNFLDFADFADNWLGIVPPGGYDNSDLNCDGIVDWYDVKTFALQWLTNCP
jgi:hypothetical protein